MFIEKNYPVESKLRGSGIFHLHRKWLPNTYHPDGIHFYKTRIIFYKHFTLDGVIAS